MPPVSDVNVQGTMYTNLSEQRKIRFKLSRAFLKYRQIPGLSSCCQETLVIGDLIAIV